MPKKTAPSTLTGHAKEIWESVYASAWDAYDPKTSKADSQEAYAAAVAWGSVKKQYKKGEDDNWVKKSRALQNVSFRLRVTKAKHDGETGKIRWHAQAANDEMEGQDEALDPSLFTDFAENFQAVMVAYATGQAPPDFGHGPAQIPILDVSHYSSLLPPDQRDKARVGSVIKLYRDGRYLHADGYFDSTEIGQMAAKSIMNDEEGVLRTSVGFWPDWGNIEVRNDVLFFKGGRKRAYLDHIAITSVPRIRSTTIDAEMEEVTMSEAATMAEDALAVLGDESVVAGLEQLVEDGVPVTESMVLRSEEVVEEEVVETEPDVAETEVVEEVVEVESDVVEVEAVEVVVEEETTESEDVEEVDPEPDVVVESGVETQEPVEEEMQTEAEVVAVVEVVQLPYGGATSFEGAIEYQQAIDEKWRVEDGWWLLRTVIDNIMSSDVEDPKAAIAAALSQYTAFLESGESLMSEAVDTELDTTEELIEPVEDTAEVVQYDPAVDGVALGGEVEDIATAPVQAGPPEAQAMSMVTVEESLGHQAVTSFGAALDKLGKMNVPVPKKQAAVRELSQIAEDTIQRELVSDANVSELVQEAVGQAMSSVEAELAQIRELLTKQSVPGSQGQTPQRPERKSHKPNIQPAKVTTRAQSFSDVIDRLIS